MHHDFRAFVICFVLLLIGIVSHTSSATVVVTGPDLSVPHQGVIIFNVSVPDRTDSYPNIVFYQLIDGQPQFVFAPGSFVFRINTTQLTNGKHTLYFWSKMEGAPYSFYGSWGPFVFTTDNGRVPQELRSNYNELYLTPSEQSPILAFMMYTNGDRESVPNAVFSSANTSVATVDPAGMVTAIALGSTTINVSVPGKSSLIRVFVNTQKNTPHFGRDGSILLDYEPGRSQFVRSLFFLGAGAFTDPNMGSDVRNAGLTTFENGFFSSPISYSPAGWFNATDGLIAIITSVATTNNLTVLLTGDEIARGDTYLYESTRGPSMLWNPNPIVYAFTKARDIGRVIGVEMVDEVSFSYGGNPFLEGRLGALGGPQNVSCVSGICTVEWPGWSINGANRFIITGAVSDPALNRNISNYYTLLQAISPQRFTFLAPAVGTRVFTVVSDPGIVFEMFAYTGHGTDGQDFVHIDAFRTLMGIINQVSGRPKLTWPVAGDHPASVIQNWQGNPAVADYSTLYWSFDRSLPQGGISLPDALATYRRTWDSKYAFVQRDRPVLWLSPASGPMYQLGGTALRIARIENDMLVFSEPHGLTGIGVPMPRITVVNNSNSDFNVRYYVSAVVDPFTVTTYRRDSLVNGTWAFGGRAFFSNGTNRSVWAMIMDPLSTSSSGSIQFGGSCYNDSAAVSQYVTMTGSPFAPYNKRWAVIGVECLGLRVRDVSEGTGTGGVGYLVTDNTYMEGQSFVMIRGSTPPVIAASSMWAAAAGAAGIRLYNFGENVNKDHPINSNALFYREPAGGDGIQPGVNPRYNGPDSLARWQAMSNANNLITAIEPFLLQPKLNSPDLGPFITTAARRGNRGSLLMAINFLDANVTETIDFTPYRNGGDITEYRMTADASAAASIPSTPTQTVTFAPGETRVWIFASTGSASSVSRLLVLGLEGPGFRNADGTLKFFHPTLHTILATVPFTTNATGQFLFVLPSNLTPTANIQVVVPGYLTAQLMGQDTIAPETRTLAFNSLLAGDFNGDGTINSLDWSVMNRNWFGPHALADINRDGVVNSLDFSFVSRNWLRRGD